MADEPRRSGRATKGQHTKLDEEEKATAIPAKSKGGKKGKKIKGKNLKAEEVVEEEEEEEEGDDEGANGPDDFVRCICGATKEEDDDEGMQWVACDTCGAWQHQDCMMLDTQPWPAERDYYCEQCKPEAHKGLLAAIDRGERPWEHIARLAPKTKGKKKGAKAANSKARLSEAASAKAEDIGTPKPGKTSAKGTPVPPAKATTPAAANGASRSTSAPKTSVEAPAQSKRKRASDVKDAGPTEKRLKSETQSTNASTYSINSLPGPRQKLIKPLSDIIQKQVGDLVQTRKINLPPGLTNASYSDGIALQIDHALAAVQGDLEGKDSAYFQQWQSLKFNMSNNMDILYKLLTQEYSPEVLAQMSSEDMLNEERKKENAALREAAEKQSVMIHEDGPRIRKTHKGDEYIGGEEVQRQKSPLPPPIHRDNDVVDERTGVDSGIVEQTVGDRQALTVDTGALPGSPRAARQASGTFDINNVYSKIGSPNDINRRPSEAFRRQSSAVTPATPTPPTKDEDIDRLLRVDEPTESDYTNNPDIKWVGNVVMAPIHNYHACGRHIAGADLGQKLDWKQVIPETPEIRGRIDPTRANDYIASLRTSNCTDVSVINLTPVDNESFEQKDKICSYFLDRDRWGVVHNAPRDKDPDSPVRDLYIIPVKADAMQLPLFMDMLEHCTISAPPEENLLLLCIIARTATPTVSADATPMDAPSATPTHAASLPPSGVGSLTGPMPTPQYSPMVGQTPGAPVSFGTPTPTPLAHIGPVGSASALNILGTLFTTTVAQKILAADPSPAEDMLRNLKQIMESYPETREDMSKLMEHVQNHKGRA